MKIANVIINSTLAALALTLSGQANAEQQPQMVPCTDVRPCCSFENQQLCTGEELERLQSGGEEMRHQAAQARLERQTHADLKGPTGLVTKVWPVVYQGEATLDVYPGETIDTGLRFAMPYNCSPGQCAGAPENGITYWNINVRCDDPASPVHQQQVQYGAYRLLPEQSISFNEGSLIVTCHNRVKQIE